MDTHTHTHALYYTMYILVSRCTHTVGIHNYVCRHILMPGRPWDDKVTELRSTMKSKDCVALVVTALDDIAWLLNLRGDSFNEHNVLVIVK